MNLSKRIRDLRYAKGWGPDDLAGRAKISRTARYHIESGKTDRPQAATLRRVARALGVSIEDLLAESTSAAVIGRRGGAEESANPPDSPESSDRVQQLMEKFRTLLASPLAAGVARIVEESYRLLPILSPAQEGPELPAPAPGHSARRGPAAKRSRA
jgi:transcriptional regulator with XRE-family HTH domain